MGAYDMAVLQHLVAAYRAFDVTTDIDITAGIDFSDDGDSLWCVIDVDRWPQEQIEEVHAFCTQKDNWHLVISNPCIEI